MDSSPWSVPSAPISSPTSPSTAAAASAPSPVSFPGMPAESTPSSSSTPSSPLSDLSRTPSLPASPTLAFDPSRRYPSPTSTATTSGTQSPIKLVSSIGGTAMRRQRSQASSDEGPPPAKKRKLAASTERTTKYLDLMKPDDDFTPEDAFQMDRLVNALQKRKKVVVIAGAGISVSAGIPDFRSPTGLFATSKSQQKLKASGKHLFDASVYRHDSSTQSFHTMVREMAQMAKDARPTPFHHLLASLAQEGRLLRLYSQNIDCIDTSMEPLATNVPLNPKGPWPTTIQLHGGLQKMVCTKCAQLEPFQADLFDGPQAPLCESCKVHDEVRTAHAGKRSHGIGRLRPRFVLYNEYNPDGEAIGNVSSSDLKARPDAVVVVGTTLKVPGTRRLVKEMCQVSRGRKDGFTAWINIDPEPKGAEFKDCWDLVVRSKCDSIARMVALPPWDCNIGDDYLVSRAEDLEGQERRSRTKFEVNVPFSPAKLKSKLDAQFDGKPPMQGECIPTPRPSPKLVAAKQPAQKMQAKIFFRQHGTVESGPLKETKRRRRKPKQQPLKAQPFENTVMQTFKPGKNIPKRDTGKGASEKPQEVAVSFHDEEATACSLPPLRPQKQCKPGHSVLARRGSNHSLSDGSTPEPVWTRTTPERRQSGETTESKSQPHGMHASIDTS